MLSSGDLELIENYLKWKIIKPDCTDCQELHNLKGKESPCGACFTTLPKNLMKIVDIYNSLISQIDLLEMLDIHNVVMDLQNQRLHNPKI